jgi:hypothetical protein
VWNAASYEYQKALKKLSMPELRYAKPEERWRTTQWFGVAPSVMRTLLGQDVVEQKQAPNGKDLWRLRH